MNEATAKIETVNEEQYIVVRRFYSNQFGTLGVMEINGERLAYTCEPPKEKSTEHDCERLANGYYGTEIDSVGNLPRIYAGRYGKENHPGMLGLTGTAPRTEICFHCGNIPKHSRGCLLVGGNCTIDKDGRMSIGNSRDTYKAIYPLLMAWGKSKHCHVAITKSDINYHNDLRWREIMTRGTM